MFGHLYPCVHLQVKFPGRDSFPYATAPPPFPTSLAYVFYPSHLREDYLTITEALATSHFFSFLFVTVERLAVDGVGFY